MACLHENTLLHRARVSVGERVQMRESPAKCVRLGRSATERISLGKMKSMLQIEKRKNSSLRLHLLKLDQSSVSKVVNPQTSLSLRRPPSFI